MCGKSAMWRIFHVANLLATVLKPLKFLQMQSNTQTRGVQDPEYRSQLQQKLAFFNRSRSRIRSGCFRMDHEPE